MSADSQVRVKVYQLDKDTNWTDRGTGFCTLEDCQGIPHLSVVAENGASQLLLDCVVQKGEVYQLQESTLIVWTEPSGEDMALSFQEQEGCQSILNQIHEFDRLLKEHTLDQSKQPVGIELPAPSMGNLDEVERTIIECNKTVALRDQLVLFITHESYLDQLRDLHETCEELEAVEELHTIYSIIRHILLLNDSSIFECIIRDDNIIGVAGMLEYDPLSPVKPGTYRDFLRYQSHFEEIVPFEDPEIEDRIHQSFRLQYLKDVVLAQMIDEGMLSAINAGLFYNHAQIANYIHHTPAFADKLFGIIRRHENPKKMHGVVQFVRQYFAMTKNFPVAYRLGLFRSLSQHGLFAVFEYTLQQGDRALRVVGADMLMSMLDQDRMLVRSYMLDQQSQAHKEPTLLELIIQGLQGDECPEIQHTCREAMRILLDTVGPPFESMDMSTDLMAGTMAEKETDDFLGMFYDTQAERLLAPLLRLTPADVAQLSAGGAATAMLHFLCDLLATMVRHHGQRAKKLVLASGVIKGVILLFDSKHSHLKLSALRFVRVCVGVHDDVYAKYLSGHGVFGLACNLLANTLPRDNLVTSACRELFVFVADHRQTSLLPHILGAHTKALERAPEVREYMQNAYNRHLLSIEESKNGGAATPTVSTSRRSAVSINMLVGRESSVIGHAGLPAGATGGWGSAVTDEIEDAYLESIDDAGDPTHPSYISPMLLDSNGALNGVAEAGSAGHSPKLPPELDSLQSCLDMYSAPAEHHISTARNDSSSSSSNGSVSKSPPAGSVSSPEPAPGGDNSTGIKHQNSIPSLFPPLKRQHSAASVVYSESNAGSNQPERHALTNGRMSVADAFPDSRPLSRKLGRRVVNGRLGAKPQIKINMTPLARTRANSADSAPHRISPAIPSSANNAAPPSLCKRQRPASSDSLTMNGRSSAAHLLPPPLPSQTTGISDGSRDSASPRACSEDDSESAPRSTALPYPHGQESPQATASSPVECHTPPKKARTASS